MSLSGLSQVISGLDSFPLDLNLITRRPCSSCSTAVTALAATSGGGPPGVAAGALAFVASDLFVARDRFVSPAFANRLLGLPLYYAAQMLLAATIARVA